MNLSDDLTPATDPTPLFRAVRRRRRWRIATRAGLSVVVLITLVAVFVLRPRPAARQSAIATATPAITAPSVVSVSPPASVSPPITMTRDELIDSLKDQTYALIRWPDGREQLLIRR